MTHDAAPLPLCRCGQPAMFFTPGHDAEISSSTDIMTRRSQPTTGKCLKCNSMKEQPMASSPNPEQPGSNCPDETKRDFYRQALIAKIGLESAQAETRRKSGIYRNLLKEAKKAGVTTEAITDALAKRFEDPDMLLITEREKLKMLDLAGIIPGIKDKLLARLDVEEPTANEKHQMDLTRAYDSGACAARENIAREENEFPQGTEFHVEWDKGWREDASRIAAEMARGEEPQPAAPPAARTRRARAKAEAPINEEMPPAVH